MTASGGYSGKLYRALNPRWAADPLSGAGAAAYGGRFNPVGTPALYCSLSPLTALREANQVGDLQPTVLVGYRADIAVVFDSRDGAALHDRDMSAAMLADSGWRIAMRDEGSAPTQRFAQRLIAEGCAGLLVPSFARGATEVDFNLVLWRWGNRPPTRLELIDDEDRLAQGLSQ